MDSPLKTRSLAVTFDDLPLQKIPPENDSLPPFEVLRELHAKLLDQITAHRIPAIGFVNEQLLQNYPDVSRQRVVLEMWLDAGLELGNHTFSHVVPEQVSLSAYCNDVVRGEALLKPLLSERGRQLKFFRHPQLHTGADLHYKRKLELFLRKRGYTIAPITIKNQDWVFATVYAGAKERQDCSGMKAVTEEYFVHLEQSFEFFERLSADLLGYELKQVLLLHVNDLNVDHFDRVVDLIRARQYQFITLDQALEDKAYKMVDDYAGLKGPSWLHRWALTMGLPIQEEPRLCSQASGFRLGGYRNAIAVGLSLAHAILLGT